MRVVFDTNVLVSIFLARGLCADLLHLVLTEHQVTPIPFQTLELGLVDGDDEWVLASAVLAFSNPPLALAYPRRCWEQLLGAC